ncbi:Protein-glutamate methylesterase/protein-glutamine glutaminase [subsurface metagenome]|nr:response regulator [Dehalococcoidia bacterium]
MTTDGIKVLVVDDEETVRMLFQRILQAAGYDVVTAADGKEALSVIADGDIDVVLLDIKMPGLSGIDVLGKISTDWPNVCVIMVTAVADVQTAVAAMKLGAYDYITKPFDQGELLRKIRQSIERWQEQLQDKQHLLQLEQNITEQTRRLQAQFTEMVNSLAREHQLLSQLAEKQETKGKPLLAGLPPELQGPISTVKEFRDALLRILKRS